jgi:hypothetical protein
MMMMLSRWQRMSALSSLLLLLLVLTTTSYPLVVEGFVSSSSSATKISRPPHHHAAGPVVGVTAAAAAARKGLLPSNGNSQRVVRWDRSKLYAADPSGQQRGAVILPIVLLLCIWMFSIPPEFRRAKICTTKEQSVRLSTNCMTGDQWMTGVQEYYQNGGGIHFDFSIDPATLADNEELLRNSWFSTTTKQ